MLLYCGVDEFVMLIYGGVIGFLVWEVVKYMIGGYFDVMYVMVYDENFLIF